eukprot:XP_027303154.1 SUN domain-containing protein 3-like [Anas platyrhynchos]
MEPLALYYKSAHAELLCVCAHCCISIFFFFSQNILHFTRNAFEKVLKIYTWMPDWALKSLGATIDVQRTSKSCGGKGAKKWWTFPLFSFAKHPETILQPRISPGDCWAFRGSQGHVVIRLPVTIWPAAFTIWHISRPVSPSREVSSAPKAFAVSVSLCLALLFGRPWPQGKAAPESVSTASYREAQETLEHC